MEQVLAKVDSAGRVLIPASFRTRLGLAAGDDVALVLEGDAVRLMAIGAAVRRSQGLVLQYVGRERRLAAELVAERRREAGDE